MMLLHTSSFLLLASVLLVIGAVNGRRLADQRTLEKDLFVATNYVTQPNEQTRHIKEEHEEEHGQEELSRKADNDDDLEDIIDYHKFETATHSPDSFNVSTITDGEDTFTPAAALGVFKNIDPTKFKWVNPDNIKPGAVTCGFLHPTLGAEPGVNYPVIKVYICMKFATNQPAPSGNIVVHCGGPGATSNCIDSGFMGGENDIGKDNVANYNIIGIDQRGMGRSWPSFYHEECDRVEFVEPDDDGKYNATDLQDYLDRQKDYVERCWGCNDYDYQFNNIEQPDGDVRSFHFLEYSGTRQLAEDLNRFRELIEAPAISLYGGSYGTTVMGTYATIFPSSVDKFIVDSSVTPYNTLEQFARKMANGRQLRYRYLKYTCWAARIKNPDSCPVEPDDIASCVKKSEYLKDLIKKSESDSFTDEELNEIPISVSDIPDIVTELSNKALEPVDFLLLLITEDPITMGKICSTDDVEWHWDTLDELLKFSPPQKRGIGLGIDCDNYDQPSDGSTCYDYDPSHGFIEALVNGQDYAGGVSAYDDDVFINRVLSFQDEYGWEYNVPFVVYAVDLASNYYWPKNVPLPIRGNPLVKGIVAGQLYDSLTPYIMTSEMRAHFPFTSLLTSQSIFHGIETSSKHGFTSVDTSAEGPCQKYITKYLETGVIDWTDGTVCGEQVPYFGGDIRK